MSIDNTSIDIAAVLVTAASGIIALFTYLHGKYREKNDFLINVIKMLDYIQIEMLEDDGLTLLD